MADQLKDDVWERDGRFFATYPEMDVWVRPFVVGEIRRQVAEASPESLAAWKEQRAHPEDWAVMVIRWAGLSNGASGLRKLQQAVERGQMPRSVCMVVRDRRDDSMAVTNLRIPLRRRDLHLGISLVCSRLGGFRGQPMGDGLPGFQTFVDTALMPYA